ncbi:MAG: DUF5688 family protein [Hespellia sp.]|nr:DUF5688 family protein [Hespellia sp.]
MGYQEFISAVTGAVDQKLEEGVCVHLHTITKNNGKERQGITIVKQQINISPTIYLEDYYEEYKNGSDIEEVANRIVHFYEKVKFEESWNGDFLKSYKSIGSRVLFNLINYEKNKKLLEEVPYLRFMDLAITFYILLEAGEKGTATIMVRNEHLKEWGIDKRILYRDSQRNSGRLLPAELSTMQSVVEEMMCGKRCCNLFTRDVRNVVEEDTMYVLSNEIKNYGAACMIYEYVLEMIGGKLQENFYILPSSVHEVIIIPESKSIKGDELNEMIREINETQLDDEEVLADHAYYYDRIQHCIHG